MSVESLHDPAGETPGRQYIYPQDRKFRAQGPYIALHRLKQRVRPPGPAQPVGLTVYCRARNEVFVGIPKVGTRSLLAALHGTPAMRQLGLEWSEIPLQQVLRAVAPDRPQITAIIRNPWARAYSAWSDKIARLDTDGHRARRIARFKGLRQGMPFADFVDWLTTPAGSDAHADRHWMSQHRFLPDCPDDRREPRLIKLEHTAGALVLFGVRLTLPRTNATGTARDGYRAAYTPALRDKIALRYREDIARFGYSF